MRKRLHFPLWWGIDPPKSWLLVRCYPYEIDFANRILKPGASALALGDGVWPCDPTTTDAERAAWDVPPWQELLARFQQMMQDAALRQTPQDWITSIEIAGRQ